jgi:ABC-type tungstate transport system permease subunit
MRGGHCKILLSESIPEGQNAIANYKIDGVQLYYPDVNDAGA